MPTDDSLFENGRAWSKASCPHCQSVQSIEVAYMPADEHGLHDALDIVCRHCRTVIATLHESTPATPSTSASEA